MSTNLNSSNPTPRTRVVRESQRAVYDRDAVNQILDEAFLCHVGFAVDGQPYVIPTSYGATEACSTSTAPPPAACCAISIREFRSASRSRWLDGLVLARSIFNHSMNYRSVVILGTATLVDDPAEKLAALRALSEAHHSPSLGRLAPAQRKRVEGDLRSANSDH